MEDSAALNTGTRNVVMESWLMLEYCDIGTLSVRLCCPLPPMPRPTWHKIDTASLVSGRAHTFEMLITSWHAKRFTSSVGTDFQSEKTLI